MPAALPGYHLRRAGNLATHPADRGDQLGHGVLGGHRVIEHRRVQRPPCLPLQHPGLGDHRPHRVEDPVRALRCGKATPPVGQRGGVKPGVIQRQAAGDLPPDIAAHRLHRFPVGQIVQRLQHQHRRGHLTRQARPARRTREQIGEQLRREHLAAMLGQKREHAARRHQMPHQRRSVHQIRIDLASALHPAILAAKAPLDREDSPVIQGSPSEASPLTAEVGGWASGLGAGSLWRWLAR